MSPTHNTQLRKLLLYRGLFFAVREIKKEMIDDMQTKQFNAWWCMGKSLQGTEQTLTAGPLLAASPEEQPLAAFCSPSPGESYGAGGRYLSHPPVKWAAAKAVSAVPCAHSAGNLGSLRVQLCHCVLLPSICLSCSLKKITELLLISLAGPSSGSSIYDFLACCREEISRICSEFTKPSSGVICLKA